jgi:salicylate biosynthesis isochorismate synthase/menaquinone-specific isochorismate synthase
MPGSATDVGIARDPRFELDAQALARLRKRAAAALRAARSGRRHEPQLISVTHELPGAIDPSEVVFASRRPGESWFCLEQPDRDGSVLAALGCARELRGDGDGRFADLGARWRALAGSALADPPVGPAGTGLVCVGGFAFAPNGGASPGWNGYPPASLVVPELSLARRDGRTWLTVNVPVAADDTEEGLLGRVADRLGELRALPLPLIDPSPVGAFSVHSPMPPSHHEEAVARAVERIRAGELEKIVLAREVQVRAPTDHDPAAVFGILREGFPSCFVYAVGRGEATFIGASPELLIRRDGQRASTVSLAGSIRRSADPAVDDHLGERLLQSEKERHENAIVARRITRALAPFSVWVTAAPEPVLVRVANIQHLGVPIRAQLARPVGAIELAGVLHPTPAVGGEPSDVAQRLIPALEGLDRGWYAGAVGWSDLAGDGEFLVALRCALLRGRLAACYAGGGIVADSDPAAELAETEVKLGALLPILAG